MKKSNSLILMFVLALLLTRCSSIIYTAPKNEIEKQLTKKANSILDIVSTNLNEINKEKLSQTKIYLTRSSFTASYSFLGKKIFIPALGNLMALKKEDQESYLELMCNNDLDCWVKLTEYTTIYYLLHELYHLVNYEKSYPKDSDAFVETSNGKRRISSFDEEVKAESVVIKYLSIYEPSLLKELKTLFLDILKREGFDMNSESVKYNWNNIDLSDFMLINKSKLYFFVYASDQIEEKSLEELLYGND